MLDDSDDDQPVTSSRPSSSSHRTVEASSKNSALERGSRHSVTPNPNKKGDQHNHSHTITSATTTAGSISNNIRTVTGRGGRVPSREGKRAYDRRSGTGRGREIKKSGGGARNWGSDQNEARIAEQQPPSLANDEEVLPEEDGEVNPQGKEEEQKKEAVEVSEELQRRPDEEDRTMTLDEYLKKKAEEEHKLASEAFKTLSIKDLVVDEIFAAKTALKKGEQEYLSMGNEGRKKSQKKSSTNKQVPKSEKLAVDFRVGKSSSFGAPSGSGRANRTVRKEGENRNHTADKRLENAVDVTTGNRVEGRKERNFEGGRSRGGGRGGRSFTGRGHTDNINATIHHPIDVSDTIAFPSL